MLKSSKDRPHGHVDQVMDRLHRARASLTGGWRCRPCEGDYISPSPRARHKRREYKKIHRHDARTDPLLIKPSQPTKEREEGQIASEGQEEGHDKEDEREDYKSDPSKIDEQPKPTSKQDPEERKFRYEDLWNLEERDEINGQLQLIPQPNEDELRSRDEEVGNLEEKCTLSPHTSLPKTESSDLFELITSTTGEGEDGGGRIKEQGSLELQPESQENEEGLQVQDENLGSSEEKDDVSPHDDLPKTESLEHLESVNKITVSDEGVQDGIKDQVSPQLQPTPQKDDELQAPDESVGSSEDKDGVSAHKGLQKTKSLEDKDGASPHNGLPKTDSVDDFELVNNATASDEGARGGIKNQVSPALLPTPQKDEGELQGQDESVGSSADKDGVSLHNELPKTESSEDLESVNDITISDEGAQDGLKDLVSPDDPHTLSSPSSHKGEAGTDLDTVHSEVDPLQNEEDAQHTDLKSGISELLDIGQNTKGAKAGAQVGVEDFPSSDNQTEFTQNSEVEAVGNRFDPLNTDSGRPHAAESNRKVDHWDDLQPHQLVHDFPEAKFQETDSPKDINPTNAARPSFPGDQQKESYATGKEGLNINIPHSEGYRLQEAEGGKGKASEENESPVSILQGIPELDTPTPKAEGEKAKAWTETESPQSLLQGIPEGEKLQALEGNLSHQSVQWIPGLELQEAKAKEMETSEESVQGIPELELQHNGPLEPETSQGIDPAHNITQSCTSSRLETDQLELPSHDVQINSSDFSEITKPGKEIGRPPSNSDSLEQTTEGETLEVPEEKESYDLLHPVPEQDFMSTGLLTPEGSKVLDATHLHDQLTVFSEGKDTIVEAGKEMGHSDDDGLKEEEHEKIDANDKTEPHHLQDGIQGEELDHGDLNSESFGSLEQAIKGERQHLELVIKSGTQHLEQVIKDGTEQLEQVVKDRTGYLERHSNDQPEAFGPSSGLRGAAKEIESLHSEDNSLQEETDPEVQDLQKSESHHSDKGKEEHLVSPGNYHSLGTSQNSDFKEEGKQLDTPHMDSDIFHNAEDGEVEGGETDPNLSLHGGKDTHSGYMMGLNTAHDTRPSKFGSKDGIEHQDDPSQDHERDAHSLHSDRHQEIQGTEKEVDGLQENQFHDGGLEDPNHEGVPKSESLEELLAAKGSPLHSMAAASIHGTGEDGSSHLYPDHPDYIELQPNYRHGVAPPHLHPSHLHREERNAFKIGLFSVPHVLVMGAITVVSLMGKAATT